MGEMVIYYREHDRTDIDEMPLTTAVNRLSTHFPKRKDAVRQSLIDGCCVFSPVGVYSNNINLIKEVYN